LKRSTFAFLVISLALAASCVRLGIWQLSRRQQRLAMNERIRARIDAPAVPVASADRDTTRSRFSNVVVSGALDYAHEIALTHRGHDGAPGVDLLTPVRLPGHDSAVLVNRGWAYAPDAMTIDPAGVHDTATTFIGYVEAFESRPADTVREGRIRKASYEAIARAIPYPILPFYVVALGNTTSGNTRVVRLERPKLDEGPHLSYAFQWFGFAAIALIGAGIVTARSMRSADRRIDGLAD
jgi:surfeit locus 1 family protein